MLELFLILEDFRTVKSGFCLSHPLNPPKFRPTFTKPYKKRELENKIAFVLSELFLFPVFVFVVVFCFCFVFLPHVTVFVFVVVVVLLFVLLLLCFVGKNANWETFIFLSNSTNKFEF